MRNRGGEETFMEEEREVRRRSGGGGRHGSSYDRSHLEMGIKGRNEVSASGGVWILDERRD